MYISVSLYVRKCAELLAQIQKESSAAFATLGMAEYEESALFDTLGMAGYACCFRISTETFEKVEALCIQPLNPEPRI